MLQVAHHRLKRQRYSLSQPIFNFVEAGPTPKCTNYWNQEQTHGFETSFGDVLVLGPLLLLMWSAVALQGYAEGPCRIAEFAANQIFRFKSVPSVLTFQLSTLSHAANETLPE